MKVPCVVAFSFLLCASALAFTDPPGSDVAITKLNRRDVYRYLVRRGKSGKGRPSTPMPGSPKVTPSGHQIFVDPKDNQVAMNMKSDPKDPNSHAASM